MFYIQFSNNFLSSDFFPAGNMKRNKKWKEIDVSLSHTHPPNFKRKKNVNNEGNEITRGTNSEIRIFNLEKLSYFLKLLNSSNCSTLFNVLPCLNTMKLTSLAMVCGMVWCFSKAVVQKRKVDLNTLSCLVPE